MNTEAKLNNSLFGKNNNLNNSNMEKTNKDLIEEDNHDKKSTGSNEGLIEDGNIYYYYHYFYFIQYLLYYLINIH
jgi:hypothetical protein